MSWETYRLGDILTLKRGHDLPSSIRQDGDVPVVSSSGITGWHNEYKSIAPGIVTGRYGTLGEVFFINENYWPLNTALYVTDFKGSNPRFLYYLLKFLLRNQQSDKAAVPGVNRNVLHELKVKFTSNLVVQELTAEILNTYDDLIENNTRQIQLLEEAARQLYKEWFVRLRFPGHEQAKVVDGVPEGFCRMSLADLCQEKRDVVRPEKLNPETPYIGLEHMPRRSITLGDWEFADKVSSSKHKFQVGDILFGKIRPYFHKVGITFTDGIASSDALVIRSLRNNLLPLVLMVVSSDAFVAMTSKTVKEGSKMPRADWKHMQRYPVLLPPEGLLNSFNSAIEPILDQLRTLVMMNKKLQEARDLLLPRLMSGEIRA